MEHGESIVLIDAPAGSETEPFDRAALEGMGHRVIVCHGPPHQTLCPILRPTGDCPLVESAHGIVFELDLERPMHRAILKRYQEIVAEDIPIRVVVSEEQAARYADLLAGVEVWTRQPSVGDLDAFSARVEAYERIMPT